MHTPRNAPCGRGLKFKKCCLQKQEEKRRTEYQEHQARERARFAKLMEESRARLEERAIAAVPPVRTMPFL